MLPLLIPGLGHNRYKDMKMWYNNQSETKLYRN